MSTPVASMRLTCDRCKAPIPETTLDTGDWRACTSCGAPLNVVTFPALYEDAPAASGGETAIDAEARCFYHDAKRAVVACTDCGRLLCGLCDVEFQGRHVCPGCINSSGGTPKIERSRLLYANVALALAFYPMLFFWATIVTAPIALYMVIRYWNREGSVTGGHRAAMIVAGTIALLQVVGWVIGLAMLLGV